MKVFGGKGGDGCVSFIKYVTVLSHDILCVGQVPSNTV